MTGRSFEPRLIAVTGLLSGEVFILDGPEVGFGRDIENTISVPDPALSRRHCVFVREHERWLLRDLGSSNGTFVNGRQVTEQPLEDGDRIAIGGSVLLFKAPLPSGGQLVDADVMAPTTRLAIEDAVYLRQPDHAAHHRAERDLRALLGVSTALQAVRSEQELHRELLRLLGELVAADGAALVLARRDGQIEVVPGGPAGRPVQVSRTVIARVIADRAGILSRDVSASRSFTADSPALGGAHSLLCVPLAARDAVLGAFYLVSTARRAFDDGHLQLVTAVGHLAAIALENVRHLDRIEREASRLHADLRVHHELIGDSAPMRIIRDQLARVARADSTVLLTGESGTGKELAARAIHLQGVRARAPFVAINCAALPDTLFESELFGHERGAFTGAVSQKKGRLELADTGTVFLDEVAELPLSAQGKLLRVLQEREFERLAGTRPIKIDIRVIAATNRDLPAAVRAGSFRLDLYFRLNVVPLTLPPLRERHEDIERLAVFFLERYLPKAGPRGLTRISPAAMACLRRYTWPGNVRELENAMERAVVMGSADEIMPEDLPEPILEGAPGPAPASQPNSLHAAVVEAKKRAIREALVAAGHIVTEAARLLGVHPNYLHRLINTLGLRGDPSEGS